jgi:hypothetical protein
MATIASRQIFLFLHFLHLQLKKNAMNFVILN